MIGGGGGARGRRNDAGDELSGWRSLGEIEPVAVVILEARGQLLRGLHGAVKSVDMVVWPLVGRSIVGDELGGGACGACVRTASNTYPTNTRN